MEFKESNSWSSVLNSMVGSRVWLRIGRTDLVLEGELPPKGENVTLWGLRVLGWLLFKLSFIWRTGPLSSQCPSFLQNVQLSWDKGRDRWF